VCLELTIASYISSIVGASPHVSVPTRVKATVIIPLFSYQSSSNVQLST
jgi:hypothetical protein